jgi:hypothetical protein
LTLPAALFGTTVRVLRTAAGRRALQLVLLVGGLFLLGFLCGEQAHAAERTPVAPVAATAPVTGLLSEIGHTGNSGDTRAVRGSGGNATRGSGADAGQAVADSVRDTGTTVRDVTRHVVTPVVAVTERAVAPVRTVVDTTTRSLDDIHAQVPDPSGAPDLGVPGLPEVSEPPALELPVPVGPAPLPGEYGGDAAHPQAPAGGNHQDAHVKARTGAGAVAAPSSVAPHGPFALPVPSLPVHPVAHRVGAPGTPVPAPTGDPDGALGKQVADGASFRHGDSQAVTPADRAPLRLVPGAAAPVDAPHTRERHRDIPVFPG